MTTQTKTLITLGSIGLAIVALTLARYYLLTRQQTSHESNLQVAQQVTNNREEQTPQLEVSLAINQASNQLELAIRPKDNPVEVGSLALQLTLKSPDTLVLAGGSKAVVTESFSSTHQWNIPINRITNNPDASVTIDIATISTSPRTFLLERPLIIATLPINLPKSEKVDIRLNTDVSLAYTKTNQPIILTLATETVTVN